MFPSWFNYIYYVCIYGLPCAWLSLLLFMLSMVDFAFIYFVHACVSFFPLILQVFSHALLISVLCSFGAILGAQLFVFNNLLLAFIFNKSSSLLCFCFPFLLSLFVPQGF